MVVSIVFLAMNWKLGLLVLLSTILLGTTVAETVWGFWAHRRINRLAIFTLPSEMIGFYKQHIEYITEHAVDPDKRRYAIAQEGPRHFIDLDHWGAYPFEEVPRKWEDALIRYSSLYRVNSAGDTLAVQLEEGQEYQAFFRRHVLPRYYADEWTVDCDSLQVFWGDTLDCQSAFVVDHFSSYGTVPYHLLHMKHRLTRAFMAQDEQAILRLSTELGHYLSDAHVPLHTTENYNGQLTNQLGIHAFWESRIPELFADERYDYFVGPAEYIPQPGPYFWKVVLESHLLLDSVLAIEKELSQTFPQDQQYCYEERLGRTVRTQCEAYAAAYQDRMNGMVEERMRAAIHAIGSIWFTCWVDAGQPDLPVGRLKSGLLTGEAAEMQKKLEEAYQKRKIKGRPHPGN